MGILTAINFIYSVISLLLYLKLRRHFIYGNESNKNYIYWSVAYCAIFLSLLLYFQTFPTVDKDRAGGVLIGTTIIFYFTPFYFLFAYFVEKYFYKKNDNKKII